MSVTHVKAAYAAVGLSSTQKSVLCCLAHHADKAGKCWPSFRYIQKSTGLSRSTVARGILKLKNWGFITTTPRSGKWGGQVSSLYTVHISAGHVTEDRNSKVTVTPTPCQHDTPPVSPRHPHILYKYNILNNNGNSNSEAGKTPQKKEQIMKIPQGQKAKDIITSWAGKGPKHDYVPPSVGNKLQKVWHSSIEEYTHPWTQETLGKATHFGKTLGFEKAKAVMEYVLVHWLDYCQRVKSDVGLYKAPVKPSVGFLLKHAEVAVNMFEGSTGLNSPSEKGPQPDVMHADGTKTTIPKPKAGLAGSLGGTIPTVKTAHLSADEE